MESFAWGEYFITGLTEVDRQHHHLVDVINRYGELLMQLEGAFSLVFLIEDVLVGARDPHGFRPLCLGMIDDSFIL